MCLSEMTPRIVEVARELWERLPAPVTDEEKREWNFAGAAYHLMLTGDVDKFMCVFTPFESWIRSSRKRLLRKSQLSRQLRHALVEGLVRIKEGQRHHNSVNSSTRPAATSRFCASCCTAPCWCGFLFIS